MNLGTLTQAQRRQEEPRRHDSGHADPGPEAAGDRIRRAGGGQRRRGTGAAGERRRRMGGGRKEDKQG